MSSDLWHRGVPLYGNTSPADDVFMPPAPPDWYADAACKGMGDVFFPPIELGANRSRLARREAMLVCASCPVRSRCLSHALDSGEKWGIWGGLDEDGLLAARNKRRRRAARERARAQGRAS